MIWHDMIYDDMIPHQWQGRLFHQQSRRRLSRRLEVQKSLDLQHSEQYQQYSMLQFHTVVYFLHHTEQYTPISTLLKVK